VSLRFPYRPFSVGRPLPSLSGRTKRPRPVITCALLHLSASVAQDGLLDTGADDTIFPDTVALALGVDLSQAPTGTAAGVGGQPLVVRYAEVTLRIADNHEQREWRGWVGFTSGALRQPLLGFAGFLEYFTATFHGDREEVELAVNTLYTGT
jgi:hypothetical protein